MAGKPKDSGALPLVAYFCGEERLLVLDAYYQLRERVLSQLRAPDFNHHRVSARGTRMAEVDGLCRTLPVMSPWRLVEVVDAESIPADDQPVLLEYVQKPDPSCTLILVGAKPDMRLKLFKELAAAKVLHAFEKLSDRELPGWLHQRAKLHGVTLAEDAAADLAAAIGPELALQDRALEKLALVVGKGGEVRGEHVGEHVATTRVETSFKIVDALAAGNLGEALQTMLAVVEAGEEPLRLLGALAYAQRQSIQLLGRIQAGMAPAVAARELRIFRNADAMARRVKAAGEAELARGMVAIANADRALKSSRAPRQEVLLQLLLELGRKPVKPSHPG